MTRLPRLAHLGFAAVPALLVLALATPSTATPATAAPPTVRDNTAAQHLVVGSKKFPESTLLAELLAQLAEHAGARVERRMNLGNTSIALASLKSGVIDVYPEYLGTLLTVLELETRNATRAQVEVELTRRFGFRLGPSLGFENSYALAARRAFAERHGLTRLSDLARVEARYGLSHEFLSRRDGWPGLERRYGLDATPRGVEHGLAYTLAAQGELDVIDVYTTEGMLFDSDLTVLEDDEGYFPPYDAAYLFRAQVADHPALQRALLLLAGRLSAADMRRMNRSIEKAGEPVDRVAADFIATHVPLARGGVVSPRAPTPHASGTGPPQVSGFFAYVVEHSTRLTSLTITHLWLTLVSVLLMVSFGVPLGYWATRSRWVARAALGLCSVLQTVPALALLVFGIPAVAMVTRWLGTTAHTMEAAAVLALFLYGLLPVVRNTKAGIEGVDAAVLDAARGLGMRPRELFRWVTLPLALPVVVAGVRTAAVIAVGAATLAAFIGAGGLGEPIITGLAVQNYDEVLAGAIPAAVLALLIDAALAWLKRILEPRGIRAPDAQPRQA